MCAQDNNDVLHGMENLTQRKFIFSLKKSCPKKCVFGLLESEAVTGDGEDEAEKADKVAGKGQGAAARLKHRPKFTDV